MSLDANALITVDELMSSMGLSRDDIIINMIKIYNSSSDATSATVTKIGGSINLTVVGGTNVHNTDFDLTHASYDTISELITGIEALNKGWVVNRLCASAVDSDDLMSVSLSVLLVANEQTLTGFDELFLQELINSVSTFAESFCRRTFLSTQHTEYHNGNGRQRLRLLHFPVITHTSVVSYDYETQSVDTTLTDHTEYEFENAEGMIYKSGGWTRGFKNWRIIYTAGYTTATMPEDLKYAVKEACKYLYSKRDKIGVTSERIGRYAISYEKGDGKNAIMGIAMPQHIVNLLAPYVKYDFQDEY